MFVGIVCVLFVWLVGGGLLGVWYGVGDVWLGAWGLLEGRVMWGLCVMFFMLVCFCVCCWAECFGGVLCPVGWETVVACVCVCGTLAWEVGLCCMFRVAVVGGCLCADGMMWVGVQV
jgi:hypothetical protein